MTTPILLTLDALNAAIAHRADGTDPQIIATEVLDRARAAWDGQHEQGDADFTYHAAYLRVQAPHPTSPYPVAAIFVRN